MESVDSKQSEKLATPPHLVWQARAGSVEAFRQLYESTAGRVYGLCLRMTGERETAEDLTQDVYIKAWNALPRFNGDAAFETWLHRIAVNASLDWLRKKRPEAREDIELEAGINAGGSWNPGAIHNRLDLERGLLTLPDKARQILVLFDIEGYSHEEIAAMLGVTTGTTKSQLHRARKLLQELIR